MVKPRQVTRDNRPPLPVNQAELWDAADLAQILRCSLRTVQTLDTEELMPRGILLAGRQIRRWRADEIRAWLRAGCPERGRWVWEPLLLPTLSQAIEQKRRELGDIFDEIRAAEAYLAPLGQAVKSHREGN